MLCLSKNLFWIQDQTSEKAMNVSSLYTFFFVGFLNGL